MKLIKKILLFFLTLILVATGYVIWPEQKLPNDVIAEKLVVNKSDHELQLWTNGQIVKTYKISLGGNPEGHKQQQGDRRTPEGLYFINDKNPNSRFYLNLGISYPNEQDLSNSSNPGGDIKIHGLKNGLGFLGKLQRFFDWTDGCISVTNREIEELYRAVPVGTPIQINP